MVPLARRNLLAEKGRFAMSIGGVEAVIPVYVRHIAFRDRGKELDVFAMSLAPPAGLPVATAVRDRYIPPPGRVNIDRVLAGQAGIGAGERLRVLGRPLTVERVHSGGNTLFQTAFLNAADARRIFGIDGLVNFFLLAVRPGADRIAVTRAAVAVVPGSESHTSEEFASSFGQRVNRGFLPVVGVLIAIGFAVGGAVIALTIYTATVERSREFDVLKAIGASGGFLYRVVLEQGVIVGFTGSASGRATCRQARNSGWRSRARSRTGRASCWPTSRPRTSTRRPARP